VSIELLLSRLTKVKGRNGSWTACCPAHEDRSPSLAIREEGGKVVMHCFAGCDVRSIVESVGMDLTDLFPPNEIRQKPAPKVRLFASDLLKVLQFEASIVAICARDMAKGKSLPEPDRQRLQLACERITTAMEASNG
jgi:hypothetical protein